MGSKFINLHDISDGLEGNWWHFIRSSTDFAFLSNIPDQRKLEVSDNDVLIHKQILEGDRFPSKRYHVVIDGEPLMLDGKDVRDLMANQLVGLISNIQRLPFGVKFDKLQKNGAVAALAYNPNEFDNFQLKIDTAKISGLKDPTESGLQDFFTNLPLTTDNPLQSSADPTFRIEPLADCLAVEQAAKENGTGTVFIKDARIEEIDLRKSVFQGSETIYYILRLKGGKVAPSDKKGVMQREFDLLNIKCSENALEKYELAKGDIISFSGKEKSDKKLKYLIQNIRKFTKSE